MTIRPFRAVDPDMLDDLPSRQVAANESGERPSRYKEFGGPLD